MAQHESSSKSLRYDLDFFFGQTSECRLRLQHRLTTDSSLRPRKSGGGFPAGSWTESSSGGLRGGGPFRREDRSPGGIASGAFSKAAIRPTMELDCAPGTIWLLD